jgi:hypothetical protein
MNGGNTATMSVGARTELRVIEDVATYLALPVDLLHNWAKDGHLQIFKENEAVFTSIVLAERCISKALRDQLHDDESDIKVAEEHEESPPEVAPAEARAIRHINEWYEDFSEDDEAGREDGGWYPFSPRDTSALKTNNQEENNQGSRKERRKTVYLPNEQLEALAFSGQDDYDDDSYWDDEVGIYYKEWLVRNKSTHPIAYALHCVDVSGEQIMTERQFSARTVQRALVRAKEAFEWYWQNRHTLIETPRDATPALHPLPQAPCTDGRLRRGEDARSRILACIDRLRREIGQAPSDRKIATALKMALSGVNRHLKVLEREGWIQRDTAGGWVRTGS